MFGIDSSEFLLVALVALLVIGPKDLPRVMRQVGQWMAKGRAMTRHVRSGFDTMMREAELEEMQKAWAAQNDAIMKATALPDIGIKNAMPDMANVMGGSDDWMLPQPPLAPEIVDAVPTPTPAPQVTNVPKPRRKASGSVTDAMPLAAPKPSRKRVVKEPAVQTLASKSDPQPSES